MRDLTIRGRAIALNTLVLSKLWYIGSILPITTAAGGKLELDNDDLINSIENTCFNYLWQGRTTHPISKEKIWLPVKKGGLGVLNIKLQCLSLKIKQLNEALDCNNTLPSSRFARYWLYKINYNTQGQQNFQTYTDFLSDCEPFGSQPAIARQTNLVFEAFINLAKGTITDFKKLFDNENKLPTCKQTYQTLTTPKEVLNNKWASQGIKTHFNNSWKSLCGNHINQYFWRMKHFALHIEGAIDSQSGNSGRPPTASRCAYCTRLSNPSHINSTDSTTANTNNTDTDTDTDTDNTNETAQTWPTSSLSDESSSDDSDNDETTRPHLQLTTQTNTNLSEQDDTDDENATTGPTRQVMTNNTNNRSSMTRANIHSYNVNALRRYGKRSSL